MPNIEIAFVCTECGGSVSGDIVHLRNSCQADIEPCKRCMERAKEAGIGEGMANG